MAPNGHELPEYPWQRLRRLDAWERAAILVWAAILLVLCGRALLSSSHSVYPIFAQAARHWRTGEDLYQLVDDPYRYSPLVAALLVPWNVLPDRLGGALWRLFNAAVYLTAFAWWIRAALPRPLTRSLRAVLFLLIVPLSIGCLNNGQSNPLILGLMLAGVAAAATERWTQASACIALASLFKIYPIAVGLLLAVMYPRRMAGRLAVALAIGLALPFLLQRPSYVAAQYLDWFAQLQFDNRQDWAPENCYRDLRLLCRTCALPLPPTTYVILQLTSAAALAGLCAAGTWRRWPPRRLLVWMLGLSGCWMTLLGSATESCTYILLAPTLSWALLEALIEARPPWIQTGLFASYALFLVTNAAVWFPGLGRSFHALGPHPLAALFLLVSLLASELSRSDRSRPPRAGSCTPRSFRAA